MKTLNVAVLGATGAVGQELLALLEQRRFPWSNLKLLASARSAGRSLEVGGRHFILEELSQDAFENIDIAFFCAGGAVSEQWAQQAVDAGALVIDNTSAFRMRTDVPLVVPEVNARRIPDAGIIANPNCSTIILALVLKPLVDAVPIRRIVVSTYQAVSGAGAQGMAELESQVRAFAEGKPMEASVLPVAGAPRHFPVAFNAIPQIDVFADDDYTKEEWKMIRETQKIFELPDLAVTATAVRLPIVRSHSESVNIEFDGPLSVDEARQLLRSASGVVLQDEPGEQEYPMPLYTAGEDAVFVGRLRRDPTVPHGINLWVVGDQIRKGAALNALQIAEIWAERR